MRDGSKKTHPGFLFRRSEHPHQAWLGAWHSRHWAGSGGGLGRPWSPVTPRLFCVAGVALGDICLRFVWQAWHLVTSALLCVAGVAQTALGWLWLALAWHKRHWADSGDGLGHRWSPVTPRLFCVAGVALADICLRFVWQWQAWHLVTSAFVFCGRRGAHGTGLALAAQVEKPAHQALRCDLCLTPWAMAMKVVPLACKGSVPATPHGGHVRLESKGSKLIWPSCVKDSLRFGSFWVVMTPVNYQPPMVHAPFLADAPVEMANPLHGENNSHSSEEQERIGCSSEGSSEPEHDSADAPPQMEATVSRMTSAPSEAFAIRQEPGFHRTTLCPYYESQPVSNIVLGLASGSSGYARRALQLRCAELVETESGPFFLMPNPKYHWTPEAAFNRERKARFVAWWIQPDLSGFGVPNATARRAVTSTITLCGRRGTWRLNLHFVRQAWHLWRWAGSGDFWHFLALVTRLGPGDAAALCVAGAALGDVDLHFVWQGWRLGTWTFTLCSRRGAYGTQLALVTRLGPGRRLTLCGIGVALGDMVSNQMAY
eukprot:s134_g35.t2